MKHFFIFFIYIYFFNNLYAQDVIVKVSGVEIFSKVLDVEKELIKFKKYNNLDGPTYSLSKSDIFMIKYENGSKDVFANIISDSSIIMSDKRKVVYETNKNYEKYLVHHKSKSVVFDYQFNIKKVKEATSVHYYGMDFSSFVLANPRKVGQEDYLKGFVDGLLVYMDDQTPPQKFIKKWLNKDELILNQNELKKLNIGIKREWITAFVGKGLSIEQVVEFTKNQLSLIEEEEGVGFVIIIDSLDKNSKSVTGIFNFFDIESGELLWSTKAIGKVRGRGMTKYWGNGIIYSLKSYFDNVYFKTFTLKKKYLIFD